MSHINSQRHARASFDLETTDIAGPQRECVDRMQPGFGKRPRGQIKQSARTLEQPRTAYLCAIAPAELSARIDASLNLNPVAHPERAIAAAINEWLVIRSAKIGSQIVAGIIAAREHVGSRRTGKRKIDFAVLQRRHELRAAILRIAQPLIGIGIVGTQCP